MGTAKGKRERKEKQKLKQLDELKRTNQLPPTARQRMHYDLSATYRYVNKENL